MLLAVGIVPRINRDSQAGDTAHAAASDLPTVNIIKAKVSGSTAELELPGNTEAINVARIYARTTGYIRERRADIGSRVKNGQVLAIIESPEIDQQLEQARANLQQSEAAMLQALANVDQAKASVSQANANIVQAQANQEIATMTNDRWTRLVSRGVLPKQAGDERRTALAAREAETNAAQAASRTAAAIVTSRNADVKAAQAAIEAQRANVRPQAFSVDLAPGQVAEILLRERPGRKYLGKVARTAGSLDTGSRTLLTEVQIDNRSAELLPGMYAQVKFTLTRSHTNVVVPGNALVSNSQGTRVVSVTSDDHAHYLDVQVGRDLGSEVEILNGLTGSERLISNPADTLVEGQPVRIQSSSQQSQASKEKKS